MIEWKSFGEHLSDCTPNNIELYMEILVIHLTFMIFLLISIESIFSHVI